MGSTDWMEVSVFEERYEAFEERRQSSFLVSRVGGHDVRRKLAQQEKSSFFPLPSKRGEIAEDRVEVEVEQLFEVESFDGVLGDERHALEDAEKDVFEVFVLSVEQ